MGNETVRNRQEVPAEDPLAELARLMGQEDEFADLLRQSETARRPAAPAPQSAAPRPSPYPPSPRPAAPRAPEPGRPAPGSFAALAAEVYGEGTSRPAAPTPRHSIEDAAREANRSFSRPEAPAPRPSSPAAPEARSAEPRAPYVPPRPQPIEPPRRPPVAPSHAAAGEAVARAPMAPAPMAPAGEPVRPVAPRPEAPRAAPPRPEAPRPEAPRSEAPRPPKRAEVPQEPAAEAESRLPSWMARAAANNADQSPAAPAQPAARAAAPVQARQFDLDEDAYDYGRSAADYDGESAEAYDDDSGADVPERRGRRRLLLIGGLMVAAVAVTAGAYVVLMRPQGASGPSGEPPVIRADQGPNKVTPAQPAPEQQASDGQKLIYDRVGGNATTGNEQVVSSEEQPVDVSQAAQPQQPRVIQTTPSQSSASSNSAEPKRVRTLTVRADGTVVPDDSAPAPTPVAPASLPSSGQSAVSTPIPLNTGTGGPVPTSPTPLSATPSIVDNVPAQERVAAAPAATPAPAAQAPQPSASPAPAGAYVVQIASVRSEQEAQATWRSMQGKYPGLLSNQPFSVKRADLGDRGVYYRAQVGSFSGRDDAVKLCEALRAQGGDCMVQRN